MPLCEFPDSRNVSYFQLTFHSQILIGSVFPTKESRHSQPGYVITSYITFTFLHQPLLVRCQKAFCLRDVLRASVSKYRKSVNKTDTLWTKLTGRNFNKFTTSPQLGSQMNGLDSEVEGEGHSETTHGQISSLVGFS